MPGAAVPKIDLLSYKQSFDHDKKSLQERIIFSHHDTKIHFLKSEINVHFATSDRCKDDLFFRYLTGLRSLNINCKKQKGEVNRVPGVRG